MEINLFCLAINTIYDTMDIKRKGGDKHLGTHAIEDIRGCGKDIEFFGNRKEIFSYAARDQPSDKIPGTGIGHGLVYAGQSQCFDDRRGLGIFGIRR
jgi:hypothetical protein